MTGGAVTITGRSFARCGRGVKPNLSPRGDGDGGFPGCWGARRSPFARGDLRFSGVLGVAAVGDRSSWGNWCGCLSGGAEDQAEHGGVSASGFYYGFGQEFRQFADGVRVERGITARGAGDEA